MNSRVGPPIGRKGLSLLALDKPGNDVPLQFLHPVLTLVSGFPYTDEGGLGPGSLVSSCHWG